MDTLADRPRARRYYTHSAYGYEARTNLTEDELVTYFPTEEVRAQFFRRVGKRDAGTKQEPVPERYRTITRKAFGTQDWVERAACRTVDVEFTPALDFKRNQYLQLMTRESEQVNEVRVAQGVCAGCPVATQCFARSIESRYANQHGESGVWAGAVEPHRRSLLRMRNYRAQGMSTIRAKSGGVQPGLKVCTRCLRPAEAGRHRETGQDKGCPGAVTGIDIIDLLTAVFEPYTQETIRVI